MNKMPLSEIRRVLERGEWWEYLRETDPDCPDVWSVEINDAVEAALSALDELQAYRDAGQNRAKKPARNAELIIEKLLREEALTETEIGLFLVDTENGERIHEEVFKRRGNVSYVRTVKRVRGKLYETLWERTATDCAYPKQPYEIKDSPYWQSL